MKGEFLETALYWAGVVSVHLSAIAEKVGQHSCVWGSSVGLTASLLVVSLGDQSLYKFVHQVMTSLHQ